ncbi:cysteine--1-D-myo-inosityl 2-amino-2-deoxy-alpha-D-glucopyranoside ligase [Granulicoccus phenolivorans]|uniref:cysteine--1-D-myo-inosityl 2-amino-2-deoxy-alpha-D-glucopyranoside ligase n=1 Tax=Granulicoccus phenolivorans TaxID=266854 RepID=UPI0004113BE7|nr:cysteine--1-D-myo-inosityl 2-amino-2-deoxy-alpha-D-glucopyranoside ligase [Granulicoccus phenolivorans]
MHAWTTPAIPTIPRTEPTPRLRLTNTATGSIEEAGPTGGTARIYVCGITPYDATHMGHANTYVTFDLVNRYWRDHGLAVDYTQNVTDVDDPLLERATATGVDWTELALSQIELFRTDMTALNVIPPSNYIGAVEAIDLVTAMLQRMPEQALYRVDNDWYFDVHTDPAFGSLSKLDPATAIRISASRGGDPDRVGKRHPLDCLVWQAERDGEPSWDSPYGVGRPGWHIECAAIANHYLGNEIDVQGGGSDLVFPHHEMSSAEAKVATGEPFARSYVHAGMVGLNGLKMSKSKGNLVLVSKLRAAGTDPMAIRLALQANHYRSDWSWTDEGLAAAEERLRLWRHATDLDSGLNAAGVLAEVRGALADDLNAPAALAAIDGWASATLAVGGDDTDGPRDVAAAADALLGIKLTR